MTNSLTQPARAHRTIDPAILYFGTPVVLSVDVAPPRVAECPVHLEAVLEAVHPIAAHDPRRRGNAVALEARIVRVHVDDAARLDGHDDRIDPARWRPLIMSFQQFFGLGDMVHESTLAHIPESAYRR